MTKSKLILVLAVMALVLALPSVVSAQRVPPHVFVGSMIDGAAATDGTVVTAMVNDAEVATATVVDGAFVLIIDQGDDSYAGMMISFSVDGMAATETASWMQGGGDELSLTTGGAMEQPDSGMASSVAATVATAWAGLNQYLVDGRGMSLYLFTVDTQGDNSSACTSEGCLGAWPPLFTADTPLVAGKADESLFGSFERADGLGTQVTYNGWPLYYFVSDAAPGDIKGQGAFGSWWVVSAAGDGITNAGPAGAQGDDGARGTTGSKGDKGDAGPAGSAGSAGRAGAAGSAGPAGPAGADGSQGSAGAAGPAGSAGSAGADGDDGSSVLAVVALILAIVALLGAGGVFFLRRGS